MKIYKLSSFDKWASEYNISDAILIEAVSEIERDIFEANLGGNVYKKRLALGNKGKRSGTRAILAFKTHDKAFFMYGFAKNKRNTIAVKELKALKKLAKIYLNLTENEINQAVKKGNLLQALGEQNHG